MPEPIPQQNPLTVDLDRVIADKSPRLARWLPKFATGYLKRVIHQDEINRILRLYSHLPPVEFIRVALKDMQISYESVGIEKLNPGTRFLFAGNHPFGGMDGLMLLDELDRRFGSGRIIVNDILMNIKPLAPLFIPINKHGRQNNVYAADLRQALQGEGQIATFPAGLCSRRVKGEVCDLPWKPSFIKNAIESERDVVPVFFEGRLSNFFYGLSNLRKRFGIKANLEMAWLVDELFRQRGKHFRIVFGEPVPWQTLAKESPAAQSVGIRRKVYALQNQLTKGKNPK